MKKKGPGGILSVALVLILAVASLAAILPVMSDDMSSAASSGTCGDGVVWSYSDQTLTISYTGEGSGRMDDMTGSKYECGSFHGIRDIRTVIFKDGVTYIGKCCFEDMRSIQKVVMADTITEIGYHAFWMGGSPSVQMSEANKDTLKEVKWSKNIRYIGDYAFRNTAVKSIDLPNAEYIGDYAFDECIFIGSVDLPSIKHLGFQVASSSYVLTHLALGYGLEYMEWGCFLCTDLYDTNGKLLQHYAEYLGGRTFDGEAGNTALHRNANLTQTGGWVEMSAEFFEPMPIIEYGSLMPVSVAADGSVCAIIKN